MQILPLHNKIFELRGKKIMLDFDLAALYEMETKYLKRAVKKTTKVSSFCVYRTWRCYVGKCFK